MFPPAPAAPLTSADEALRLILESVRPLRAETVALEAAVGRVAAEDVAARVDLPPFDGAAMDGFAVRARDFDAARETRLRVARVLRAGALAGAALAPGEAVKIMTGAPLPRGADAVVMRERAREDGGRVWLPRPRRGQHVRRRGEDVRRGGVILGRGALIRPYEVALLAAQGVASVKAIAAPRAALLSTGDELVEAWRPLAPGRIRDANGPALAAALARWGAVPLRRGIAGDEPARLRAALRAALAEGDLLLVSGGVSAGDFDFTKAQLEGLGLKVVFWKAAIKPGKPLLFGLLGGKPVFGLPGNPVAALVCVEEFVRPAVERLQGRSPRYPSYHLRGRVENDYPTPPDRRQYLFCRAAESPGGFRLRVLRPQGSAMLGMAARANALAVSPAGAPRLRKGDEVAFRWLK